MTHDDPVRIEFGRVPAAIPAPEYEDASVQATGEEYLFRFPQIGRIYVRGGDRIAVDPVAPACEALLWQTILGTGASIAGFRRGLIPIHASAVVCGDDCVAFAGQSTAGKSTLAALLVRLGYGLHADDLCLADPRGHFVMAGAGVPELRLCEDAVSMAGWQCEDGGTPRQTSEAAKSVFRWEQSEKKSRRIRGIYVLEFASPGVDPGIYPVDGVAALNALVDCLRLRLPLLLTGAARGNFEALTAVARRVPIFRFVRPRDAQQSLRWTERLAAHFDA